MAIGVLMPKSGISVDTCVLSEWMKKVGDPVKKGDVLFSYETDKSAFEEAAPQDGVLLAAFFEEGDDVPVMVNVCVIGEEGEDVSAFKPQGENQPDAKKTEEKAEQPQAQTDENKITREANNISNIALPDRATECGSRISPRARMTARDMGVSLDGLAGSGPYGRIIERDVRAQAERGDRVGAADLAVSTDKGVYKDVKFSNIRKVIARNMTLSLSTIPQLTHSLTFDATEIMALRARLKKEEDKALSAITLNDMVLFAVSRTLLDFPELNAHTIDSGLRLYHQVNLGVAVDTPRGLMVPTIFGANKLSIKELAARAKQLALSCQSGGIDPQLLQAGTFTVSNLGSLHVEHFTPIINPPQTGILGVNTITQRVREVKGQLKAYPAMGLSLTYDHRAIDGAPASRFLMKLQANLETFSMLFMK